MRYLGWLPFSLREIFVLLLIAGISSGSASPHSDPQAGITMLLQRFPGEDYKWQLVKVYQSPSDLPKVAAAGVDLAEDELVLGIDIGEQPVAYPIRFLAVYEVLNDRIAGRPVVVTWCPLAGSARAFEGTVGGKAVRFDFADGLNRGNLHFSTEDLTIWAEDSGGHLLAGTLSYEYVWEAFWPRSREYPER